MSNRVIHVPVTSSVVRREGLRGKHVIALKYNSQYDGREYRTFVLSIRVLVRLELNTVPLWWRHCICLYPCINYKEGQDLFIRVLFHFILLCSVICGLSPSRWRDDVSRRALYLGKDIGPECLRNGCSKLFTRTWPSVSSRDQTRDSTTKPRALVLMSSSHPLT